MAKYFFGILFIAIGFSCIWKTEAIFGQIGSIDWAENHLNGGTRSFLKLFGLVLIIAAFFLMTGIVGQLILRIFVPQGSF